MTKILKFDEEARRGLAGEDLERLSGEGGPHVGFGRSRGLGENEIEN